MTAVTGHKEADRIDRADRRICREKDNNNNNKHSVQHVF